MLLIKCFLKILGCQEINLKCKGSKWFQHASGINYFNYHKKGKGKWKTGDRIDVFIIGRDKTSSSELSLTVIINEHKRYNKTVKKVLLQKEYQSKL